MVESRLCKHWTADEDAELEARLARHETFPAIAKALRRGLGSVRWRISQVGLDGRLAWSAKDDARLREAFGKIPTRDIARELFRSVSSIKNRVHVLGIKAPRTFTPEEIAVICEKYPTHTAQQVAAMLPGRKRHWQSVCKIANALGLRKVQFYPPEVIERLKQLHAEGCPDRVICERMNLRRDQVKHLRANRLKLPTIPDIEGKRQSVRTQHARLGIKNPADLRNRAHAAYALECGWPAEWKLRVREVQILNVLAARGAMTALEIAQAIGANTSPTFRTGKRRILLSDSGRDGTYTGALLKKGLIVYLQRFGTGKPQGQNRKPGFYQLSAEAIQHLEERDGDRQADQKAM